MRKLRKQIVYFVGSMIVFDVKLIPGMKKTWSHIIKYK